MADQKPPPPRTITSIWPGVVLLAVGAGMLLWAQNYSPTSARFPSIVSLILIVLALLDIWSRTTLPGQSIVAAFGGTGFGRREMDYDPALRAQFAIIAWVLACFIAMAVVGIMASTPVFCAAFVRWRGGRSIRDALIVGAIVLVFQYSVFEWLLDYELYRGLLFTRGGLAAW